MTADVERIGKLSRGGRYLPCRHGKWCLFHCLSSFRPLLCVMVWSNVVQFRQALVIGWLFANYALDLAVSRLAGET